jgi:hypothetical protein
MFVKLQTTLGDSEVILCGTVKGVTYKEKQNLSVLHIEAVPPSQRMKNRIHTFVYGIFGKGDSNAPVKPTLAAVPPTKSSKKQPITENEGKES